MDDIRTERIGLRVSKAERALFEALAKHHGIDLGGVMRMAALKMAREEGIELPLKQEKPPMPKRRGQ